ncbi:MAG TPA: TadE family protein [Actinomycetes bacterium]|nr:TadE family protein [Actinomycetes bacterium]
MSPRRTSHPTPSRTGRVRGPWDRSDRGSAAPELAVLLPVFILFFGLVMYAGRLARAEATTESAARWAARTMSLARDPATAAGTAQADAAATLDVGSAACATMGFDYQISDTAVTVMITCQVDVSELMLLPVPGSQAIQASSTEVRDQLREVPAR